MKKRIVSLAMAMLLLVTVGVQAYAVPSFLNYWYAERYNALTEQFIGVSNSINFFTSTPTMYKQAFDGFSTLDFSSYFIHGRDQWLNNGLTSYHNLVESNANFKVYRGSLKSIVEVLPNYPSYAAGYTEAQQISSYGNVPCADGYMKLAQKQQGTKVGIKYNPELSATNYKNLVTHEMGHGFGWYDHSSSRSDVMWPTVSTVTSLTSRDVNHIKQMYN